MISIDFSTDSYHRLKDILKVIFKDYKLKWISDHWESESVRVDAVFMGHLKPAILTVRNAPLEFSLAIKRAISSHRLSTKGAIRSLKHTCGEAQFILQNALVCPICDYDTINPDVKFSSYEDKQIPKVNAEPNIKGIFHNLDDNPTLDKLILFISFNLRLMEPSKIETWLDGFVTRGVLRKEDNRYIAV